jgi:peptide/nickel transport system ATP-binding protein
MAALIEAKNVTKIFKIGGLVFGSKLTAVDDVSLIIKEEETKVISLVGESGSGKTTLARILLGLIKPTKGTVAYRGNDVFKLKGARLMEFRKEVQPIFQNPFESFNSLKKVDRYLIGTILNYKIANNEKDAKRIADNTLHLVGLSLDEIEGKYPHEFSGGELQRVSIARALLTNPKLLIADEPVSMIDASLRMEIINIMLDLKQKLKMSILYITHDLATAYYVSDDIAIMYRGSIVEQGPAEEILTKPLHPYTAILLDSLPKPDPKNRWKEEIKLSGLEVKEFEALGCKFANRCPYATNRCLKARPPLLNVKGRLIRCWLLAE